MPSAALYFGPGAASSNRLTSSTVNLTPTPLAKTFSYSAIGNMLTKSDVGTYNYPTAGQALPPRRQTTMGSSQGKL